jgi:hypothetical protein
MKISVGSEVIIAGPRLRKMPTVGKGNRQPKVIGQCGMSNSLRAYSLRAPATRFWRVRVRAPELVRSGGTNCSFRRGRSQFGYACLATEPEPALHQTREGLRARCGGRLSCQTVGAINGRLRHNCVPNTNMDNKYLLSTHNNIMLLKGGKDPMNHRFQSIGHRLVTY